LAGGEAAGHLQQSKEALMPTSLPGLILAAGLLVANAAAWGLLLVLAWKDKPLPSAALDARPSPEP
jgi:hypothetical protein